MKFSSYLMACTNDSCNNVGLKSPSSPSFFVSAIVLQARRSTNSSASNGSYKIYFTKCFFFGCIENKLVLVLSYIAASF